MDDEVDILHVERNQLSGCSYLDIIDIGILSKSIQVIILPNYHFVPVPYQYVDLIKHFRRNWLIASNFPISCNLPRQLPVYVKTWFGPAFAFLLVASNFIWAQREKPKAMPLVGCTLMSIVAC
jgi:hypothetical protein